MNVFYDMQRLRAMVRKEFIQVFRDPQTLRVMILAPLIQLIVLGYAITNDPKDLRVGVLDLDHTAASRQIVQDLAHNGYFVVHMVDAQGELLEELDSGRSQVTLQVPPGFERTLRRGGTARVQMMADGSDTNTATLAMAYVTGTLGRYSGEVRADWRERHGGPDADLVEVRGQIWYNPALLSRNYILPGVVALILSLITSLLTVLSIAREREVGTLEQLMVTPLSTREFMLGKMATPAGMAFANGLLVVAVSIAWFRVPFRGNILFLLGAMAPFIVAILGLGLLISSKARTQQQAQLLNFMNMMPQTLLSGFIFPIATMPAWAQALSALVPMRYFLEIVRGVYLKGVGLDVLWPQVLALFVLSGALFGLGARTFRRRLD